MGKIHVNLVGEGAIAGKVFAIKLQFEFNQLEEILPLKVGLLTLLKTCLLSYLSFRSIIYFIHIYILF